MFACYYYYYYYYYYTSSSSSSSSSPMLCYGYAYIYKLPDPKILFYIFSSLASFMKLLLSFRQKPPRPFFLSFQLTIIVSILLHICLCLFFFVFSFFLPFYTFSLFLSTHSQSNMPFFTLLIFFFLSNHSLLTAANANANANATTINANSTTAPPPPLRTAAPFKPGIAAVVGILTTTFSITFLLLLYVKHCKGSSYGNASRGYPPSRRNSGINRKVIESLPMFRFSSLRGHKDGLECAVCLNRFEAEEVLRLLPKCKHAFHVECVDTWLEAHSTCPLCRYRVDPEDVLLVDTSALATPRCSAAAPAPVPAPRVSGRHSSAGERRTALQIIAENPRDDLLRGRVSLDSWNSRRADSGGKMLVAENPGRRGKAGRKDGQLPVQGDRHRVEHRIIISGGGEEVRRWSDVQAADLLYLGSEMLLGGGEEGESGSGVINGRSVSEITGMSRYRGNNGEKQERERQEEGVVKRWLAWISHHHNPAVQSATSAASPILL